MPINPESLNKQIDHLWADLAHQSEGDELALMRACSLTLIVLADSEENPAGISETLAQLVQMHPSRAIVIRVASGEEDRLEADVRAQCWMPVGDRQQICSEQVEVQASEKTLGEVPSVLLPLIVPDLPAVMWCRSARAVSSFVFEELAALASRVVMDVDCFPDPRGALAQLVQRNFSEVTTDLSWTRLTRWREMVAQVFENPAYRLQLPDLTEIRISYTGSSEADIPPAAYLMAGWLVNCLRWGWEGASTSEDKNKVLQLRNGAGKARVSFRFEPGAPAGSRLSKVDLAGAGEDALQVGLERNGGYLDIQVVQARKRQFGTRVWFPPSHDVALLNEELRVLAKDRVFEASLETAARIVAATA